MSELLLKDLRWMMHRKKTDFMFVGCFYDYHVSLANRFYSFWTFKFVYN